MNLKNYPIGRSSKKNLHVETTSKKRNKTTQISYLILNKNLRKIAPCMMLLHHLRKKISQSSRNLITMKKSKRNGKVSDSGQLSSLKMLLMKNRTGWLIHNEFTTSSLIGLRKLPIALVFLKTWHMLFYWRTIGIRIKPLILLLKKKITLKKHSNSIHMSGHN